MEQQPNIHYAILNGLYINTPDAFYTTIKQQLLIPEYFGNNLDALEEVLADLEWLSAEEVYIIIINESKLLVNDIAFKETVLDIFDQNDNKKLKVIITGT